MRVSGSKEATDKRAMVYFESQFRKVFPQYRKGSKFWKEKLIEVGEKAREWAKKEIASEIAAYETKEKAIEEENQKRLSEWFNAQHSTALLEDGIRTLKNLAA